MSDFAQQLLDPVKTTLRVSGSDFDEEIASYIDTCAADMQNSGILSKFFAVGGDPQILQAVRWYCLSVFGLYNEDSEKYMKSYMSLKSTLCTQRKYTVEGG